ncbi:MAG TPA: hypothetical protein VFF52_24270 [Isosphaeraceae bacterium]|nr:hypothetical protein [Isosphaeraceae bacterium]
MRLFGFRLPIFVAILWAGIGSTVWALGYHDTVETVYVTPTSSTVALPTSYVVAGSWLQPTAYLLPTSYAMAYWADPLAVVSPSYVTTTRVRTGLLGRTRVVERSAVAGYGSTYVPTVYSTTYVPTVYPTTPVYRTRSYVPTVLSSPLVWESAYVVPSECVCPEVIASTAAPARSAPPGTTSPRGSGGSRAVTSEPADEAAMPSDVGPPPGSPAAAGAGGGARGAAGSGGQTEQGQRYPNDLPGTRDNTPTPPAPEPIPPPTGQPARPGQPTTTTPPRSAAGVAGGAQTESPKAAQAAATSEAQKGAQSPAPGSTVPGANPNPDQSRFQPPTAPGGTAGDLAPLPPDNTTAETRREVQRPANLSRSIRAPIRNVLTGFVQSSASGEREEGVRLTLTNPADRNLNKVTSTDAFGRFAVSLADGDWTVNVTMPSGRVYAVSQLRVSNGQITDSRGRRIPSLEITR